MVTRGQGQGYYIERFWVWISEQGDGDEGITSITAAIDGRFTTMPLVCSTLAMAEHMRQYAEKIANDTGKPLVLARFDRRVNVDRVEP